MRRVFVYPIPRKFRTHALDRRALSRLLPAVSLFTAALLLLISCRGPQTEPHRRLWVSLSPSVTEILYAVGVGPQVAGTCAPADYPPEAAGLPKVASWEKVDVEAIIALAPKACFTIRGMQSPEALRAIRRLGVPVYVYPMRNLKDLWACMEDVGRRTGHGSRADAVVEGLQARVRKAAGNLPAGRSPAVVVVGLDPLVAVGRGSFLNDVLRTCGFRNALDEVGEAYPVLSLESVVASRPDVVVFPEGEIPSPAVEGFMKRVNGLLSRPAVRVMVPADLLVRPGPRTVDGIERLCRARREEGRP